MLIGNTEKSLANKFYPAVINEILSYLNGCDLASFGLGRHEIPGYDSEQAWFVILEYQKQALDELQPEVHKYHSDLQIVLSGCEKMAWSLDTGDHQNAEQYNQERDLQFYKSEGVRLNYISAAPGQFYLFTPNIVHITNIMDGDTQGVRKLVVKIHNDLLEVN